MGKDINNITEEEAINLMLENPRIIIRPIFISGKQVLFRFSEAEYKEKLS